MIRGDIYMLDFGIPFGSEPGRRRPVVIIQADKENLDNLNTKVRSRQAVKLVCGLSA